MDDFNSKECLKEIQSNPPKDNVQEKEKIVLIKSNDFPLEKQEFVTKGRKTVINSSIINLESPKKENLSRSKRMSLLRKTGKDITIDNTNIELFSFGKPLINSSKKLNNRKNDENKNLNYKKLIKRISDQLRKRVKLPTCKIIKIYQPYRNLILRIAEGIKRTSKQINLNNINKKKERDKFGVSLISKEKNQYSKKKISNSKEKKEQEEAINLLLNMDHKMQDNDFINQFENFLLRNDIIISTDNKLPSFKIEEKKFLLSNLDFWIKYIEYICLKYKKELNFFNFINFIELFYVWIDFKKYDSYAFNKLIIQKIEFLFDKDKINNFLLTHKFNSLDDIFSRYKNMNILDFPEMKLEECQCPNCQNIKEKVINYNKTNTYISYSEENNLNYSVNKEIIKYPESKTIYDDKLKCFSIYTNSNDKLKKITDYYRCSIKKNPSKKISQNKVIQYRGDKKISDFFSYKKDKIIEGQKKEREGRSNQKKSKSKGKTSSNSKKLIKKHKKSKEDIRNEILDLLNLNS